MSLWFLLFQLKGENSTFQELKWLSRVNPNNLPKGQLLWELTYICKFHSSTLVFSTYISDWVNNWEHVCVYLGQNLSGDLRILSTPGKLQKKKKKIIFSSGLTQPIQGGGLGEWSSRWKDLIPICPKVGCLCALSSWWPYFLPCTLIACVSRWHKNYPFQHQQLTSMLPNAMFSSSRYACYGLDVSPRNL